MSYLRRQDPAAPADKPRSSASQHQQYQQHPHISALAPNHISTSAASRGGHGFVPPQNHSSVALNAQVADLHHPQHQQPRHQRQQHHRLQTNTTSSPSSPISPVTPHNYPPNQLNGSLDCFPSPPSSPTFSSDVNANHRIRTDVRAPSSQYPQQRPPYSRSPQGTLNQPSLENIRAPNINTASFSNRPRQPPPNEISPPPSAFPAPLSAGPDRRTVSFVPFPPALVPGQQPAPLRPQRSRDTMSKETTPTEMRRSPTVPSAEPASTTTTTTTTPAQLSSSTSSTPVADSNANANFNANTDPNSNSDSKPTSNTMAEKERVAPIAPKSKPPPVVRGTIPRTSSIDSAISSISSLSTSQKTSLESTSVNPADIANLISAAGSAETVIMHLLKEKRQADSQNAQLWKLVDKQRKMVLTLNKDLERSVKEKEKYKKLVKEFQDAPPPLPAGPERTDSRRRALESARNDDGKSGQTVNNGTTGPIDSAPMKSSARDNNENTPVDITRGTQDSTRSTPSDAGHIERVNDGITSGSPSSASLQSAAEQQTNAAVLPKKQGSPQQSGPISPPARKPPPAPLQLAQSQKLRPHIQLENSRDSSGSEYEDILEDHEIPMFERGRRKTREDDDRLRENMMIQKEQELRSRSNKKMAKNIDPPETVQREQRQGFPGMGLPSSPRDPPTLTKGRPPHLGSLAESLGPAGTGNGALDRNRLVISPPPMSPGLPNSPRPIDRPIGSPLPRMPRDNNLSAATPTIPPPGASSFPHPRAAHGVDLVGTDGLMDSGVAQHEKHAQSSNNLSANDPTNSQLEPGRSIYRGLMSEEYPDLLLTPHSLPSIVVKVASSRLRPSRLSYMTPKVSEEDPVFTLGVFSRAHRAELWRVEKVILALPQLDQQMKQVSSFSAKLPERAIFSGHSPAKIDARRAALNSYFEILLDTPMDDKAALVICQFLTADAIEPRDDETSLVTSEKREKPNIPLGPDGKPMMEGYLTKRGKNFGGWKSRYFVLHGPELKYFESPGGPHLGTIKIQHAQIGTQSSSNKNQSPSRNEDDTDSQYRHAFLILEPKKKDSTAFVRHVLCAESDEERDSWVEALLSYVERNSDDEENNSNISPRTDASRSNPNSATKSRANNGKGSKDIESPDSEKLRGLSYDDMIAAEAPVRGGPMGGKSSPVSRSGSGHELVNEAVYQTEGGRMSPAHKNISAPTNGVRIQDPGAWGNKAQPTPLKEKKRSIWGFRAVADSNNPVQRQDSLTSLQNSSLERKDAVRPVFGLPLAEAVEFCSPQDDIDCGLPAVVYRCISYLRAKGAEAEEGLFRLSGSNVVIKALKERFNTEGDLDFLDGDHYYDVHAVASLFKQYLRELPTTVLTKELHLDFIRVLDFDEKSKKIAAFHNLVRRLPPPNYKLLVALSQFLIIVVNNSGVNKMTVRNVGIVFAPTLNIPAPVFATFLTDFDAIFGDVTPPEADHPSVTELTAGNTLTSEDIRSPRHQMFTDLPTTPAYDQASFRARGMSDGSEASGAGYRDPRENYDTGFVPMQPTYEQPQQQYHNTEGLLTPGSGQPTSKNKRRESSLLFMSMGNRKGSMAKLRDDQAISEDRQWG